MDETLRTHETTKKKDIDSIIKTEKVGRRHERREKG